MMTMSNANPNKPATNNHQPKAPSDRERAIADAAARRKVADAAVNAKTMAKAAAPGSREARVAEATAPGTVKPSKSDRPTKIPASANMTKPRVDDTSTTTEGDIRDRKRTFAGVKDERDVFVEDEAKAGADGELDAAVKPKKAAKDPNMLSVGDVARELGIDPKRARARLRAADKRAVEGRWPKVLRGSPEHDQLIVDLSDPGGKESRNADEADAT